jgi:hypothetical protein
MNRFSHYCRDAFIGKPPWAGGWAIQQLVKPGEVCGTQFVLLSLVWFLVTNCQGAFSFQIPLLSKPVDNLDRE